MIGYYVIFGVFMLLSMIVGGILKNKFRRYSKVAIGQNLSGREIAERMLRENDIYNVSVISSKGSLSDHYNPIKKTVNLSPDVYNGINVVRVACLVLA